MPRPHRSLADRANDPLIKTLAAWRQSIAEQKSCKPFHILTNRMLENIALARPATLPALRAIHGLGTKRVDRYGAVILQLVAEQDGTPPPPAGKSDPPTARQKPAGRHEMTEEEARARLRELDAEAADATVPWSDGTGTWRLLKPGHRHLDLIRAERLEVQAMTPEGRLAQRRAIRELLRDEDYREGLSRRNIRTLAQVTDRAIDQLVKNGKIERVPEDAAETKADDMLYRLVRA